MNLALAVVPLIPALTPTKVAAASKPWEKIQPMLTSDLAFPPKPLGTCRLHRDAPTQDHTLKTRIGNFGLIS